jgi:flagellar protein FlgJ
MANATPPIGPLSAPATGANTYTDLNALAGLAHGSRSPQALHAIAQQVDALFLQMMLKSMRDATAGEGEADSNEMGMYQDLFDKQVALSLSQHQDLGLGSMVTRQLAAQAAASGSAASGSASPASTAPAAGAAAPGTPVAGVPTASTRAVASGAPGTGGDTATTTDMVQSASQFVQAVLPAITQAAETLGVSPLGMLAQAALETGWGTRMARTADGSPSLNMFGIKAGEDWDGARAGATTLEFSGGVATQRHTAFRAYGSVEESVADFAQLLGTSPRYRAALSAGGSAQSYVESIGRSGYATDPEYGAKLHAILNGGLLRMALNRSAAPVTAPAGQTGS